MNLETGAQEGPGLPFEVWGHSMIKYRYIILTLLEASTLALHFKTEYSYSSTNVNYHTLLCELAILVKGKSFVTLHNVNTFPF